MAAVGGAGTVATVALVSGYEAAGAPKMVAAEDAGTDLAEGGKAARLSSPERAAEAMYVGALPPVSREAVNVSGVASLDGKAGAAERARRDESSGALSCLHHAKRLAV